MRRSIYWLAAAIGILATGCPMSSQGIDLSSKGGLTMTIARTSGSGLATATAQVVELGLLTSTKLVLADDQVLSVNGKTLTATTRTQLGLDAEYSATVEAVDEPDEYSVSFDDQGVMTTVSVAPPQDFSGVSPKAGAAVSVDGFALSWDQTSGAGATVEVAITGTSLQANSNTGAIEPVSYTVNIPAIADDGGIMVGASELTYFQTGGITVTLTRVETASQPLNFKSGEIRTEIVRELPLTLE